jgi:hypothetical protein
MRTICFSKPVSELVLQTGLTRPPSWTEEVSDLGRGLFSFEFPAQIETSASREVSVLKASREATLPKHSMRSERGSIYHPIAHPSQIIFAHPEALLEDKKIFQLKSKSYQDSVKAIVIEKAHLVEEW